MGEDEKKKLPPGAEDFAFPEEAGLAKPREEVVQPKYYEGQAYNNSWWGQSGEFNEDFKPVLDKVDKDGNPAPWLIVKKGDYFLTEAGVKELERVDKEKKSTATLDRSEISKIAHQSRKIERPSFPTSHAVLKSAEPVVSPKSSVDRLADVQRQNEAIAEQESETEEEVSELFEGALATRGFKVHESNLEAQGTSPLGKPLYSFDVTMSRTGRHGKNKPMSRFYEGSKESILEKIGTLR